MHFPVWIDLKGQDTVPETLHHVVSVNWTPLFTIKGPCPRPLSHLSFCPQICVVDPKQDDSWKAMLQANEKHIHTDGVHMKNVLNVNDYSPG